MQAAFGALLLPAQLDVTVAFEPVILAFDDVGLGYLPLSGFSPLLDFEVTTGLKVLLRTCLGIAP